MTPTPRLLVRLAVLAALAALAATVFGVPRVAHGQSAAAPAGSGPTNPRRQVVESETIRITTEIRNKNYWWEFENLGDRPITEIRLPTRYIAGIIPPADWSYDVVDRRVLIMQADGPGILPGDSILLRGQAPFNATRLERVTVTIGRGTSTAGDGDLGADPDAESLTGVWSPGSRPRSMWVLTTALLVVPAAVHLGVSAVRARRRG